MHCTIHLRFVSLVIGYVMVYHVTYTNYFSLLKFYVTGCFQYIHSWRRATIWKKVSTFEQSEYIIWIFSTTSSVKDNVLWMKCNFNVAFKKWVCFKILLRDVCSLGRTNKFLDNMVVFKILEIEHIDCEKFMFIYQQNGSHLGNSSLYYVSHLGSMIFQ